MRKVKIRKNRGGKNNSSAEGRIKNSGSLSNNNFPRDDTSGGTMISNMVNIPSTTSSHFQQSAADAIIADADVKVIDTYASLDINSLLRGKHGLTNADYAVINHAIKYYVNSNVQGTMDGWDVLQALLRRLWKINVRTLQDYKAAFKVETDEAAFSVPLKAFYADGGFNLITYVGYVYIKTLPMKSSKEWLDNFRLTGILNVYTLIMWPSFDHEEVFTINSNPGPICRSVMLTNPIRSVVFAVGPLRAFMLVEQLIDIRDGDLKRKAYASLKGITLSDVVRMFEERHRYDDMYDDVHDANGGMDELSEKALRLCDACANIFPFYTGGAHGCDIFDLKNRSLSMDEIKQFCRRYPSRFFGLIPNTQTYASRRGEHWVAWMMRYVEGRGLESRLICSQGSDYSCFKDGGKIVAALKDVDTQYSEKVIQHDGYNCGLFSALTILGLLSNENDIDKAVEFVGDRAGNIVAGKDINTFREKITGAKT